MHGRFVFSFFAPAVALGLSVGLGQQAHAATLRVPSQFATIQQTIDATQSGDAG